MPLGVIRECSLCLAKDASIWRKDGPNLICNNCYEKKIVEEKEVKIQKLKDEELQVKSDHTDVPKPSKIVLRKSTRMTRNYKTRSNPYALPKPILARGRGRKGLQRRALVCAPPDGRAWCRTNRIYLQDGYLRVGDVVSIIGSDSAVYYAQVRGFLIDLYGEKRAVITWLLPKPGYKPGVFKPECFYVGPDEDTPRQLNSMEFEFRPSVSSILGKKPSRFIDEIGDFLIEPINCIL